MTAEQREYLAGWTFNAEIIKRYLNSEGPKAARSLACGYITLATWPREKQWFEWDPFTPFGAGQADAALSCWGF